MLLFLITKYVAVCLHSLALMFSNMLFCFFHDTETKEHKFMD